MKKNKSKRKIKKIFKILIAILFIIGGTASIVTGIYSDKIFKKEEKKIIYDDIPKPVVTESEVSLVMVGDALIHGAVYQDARRGNSYNFKPIFTEVKDIIKKNELAFYNQETILGGTKIGLSHYPRFNSPYEVGDAFIDSGFNLVSLATNHTLDRGFVAIKNSREYWNSKEDVIAAGSYSTQEEKDKIVVKEKNGIKYGLLAYTTLTNGLVREKGKDYSLDVYNKELVKKDIEKLRDKVDLLMVSMHWGVEYSHSVSKEQKEIAKYLSSLGVDIIIGTHPHVVEPIEFIDDTLVIYSLGNFVSSQIGVEKLTGLMVEVDITKTTIDDNVHIKLSKPRADLIYTCKASICGDYKVYPYNKIPSKVLANKDTYYKKYMKIVRSLDKNIDTIYTKEA